MRVRALQTGLAWALCATAAAAQTWKFWADTFPEPGFQAGARTRYFLTEEVQYIFTVREFTPHVEFAPVSLASASWENPERTAISLISAMAAGDLEWWRSGWTEEATRRAAPRSAWPVPGTTQARAAELTHRIETGRFVVIAYRLLSGDPRLARRERARPPSLLVTRQDGDRWLATDELEGDPVLRHWANPGARPRRIER